VKNHFRFALLILTVNMLLLINRADAAPQYFGYYASSMAGVGSGEYSAYISDHANVSWIQDTAPATVSKIAQAASFNMKSVVSLTGTFFNGFTLNPNYQVNWNAFADAITPSAGNIAAFYVMDEPNVHNVSAASLQTITAIKQRFPSIPIAVIYSYSDTNNYPAIRSFDWVGIDCYSEGNFNCGGTPYLTAYNNLKAQLSPTQRTMLIPQAGTRYIFKYSTGSLVLVNEAYQLRQLAFSDPSVIGVFSFIYQSFVENGSKWYGLEEMPLLRCTFVVFGNAVVNRPINNSVTPVYRSVSSSEHFFSTNQCEGSNAKFIFEGIGFYVLKSNIGVPNTIPLYRCLYTTYGKHFVSTNSNCEGYKLEGTYGYIYTYQAPGTTPLYRFRYDPISDHLETTNFNEGIAAGYTYEYTHGYVPIAP
jgi:hypothetical protein